MFGGVQAHQATHAMHGLKNWEAVSSVPIQKANIKINSIEKGYRYSEGFEKLSLQ